jgi:hypothetical protein
VKQEPINHVALILDASSSMQHLASEVVKVADRQIADLADLSKQLNQETRVSVYSFADKVECIIFDQDVLRLGSIADYYRAEGNTALIDATLQAQRDLAQTAVMYGDHAFLMFVLTDGEENRSAHTAAQLVTMLKGLSDVWTVACLVPNSAAKFRATRFGFAPGNVAIWDASSQAGMREAGETMRTATTSYMTARASGLKSTTGLFTMDATTVNHKTVAANLKELTGKITVLPVKGPAVIREFIESKGLPFTQGSYYFPLVKRERIAEGKNILIRHKISGKVYGGPDARAMVGLPDKEVSVSPQENNEYDIFVQSTSQNRKLIAKHDLLVLNN